MKDTKYESDFYSVKVGPLSVESPDRYLVINKETGVQEFDHEVLPFVLEWMSHFTKRMQDIAEGKIPSPTDDVAEIAGRFN